MAAEGVLELELVEVPEGEFIAGTDAAHAEASERPARVCSLGSYWIGKSVVSGAQYARFCAATGRPPPSATDHRPVVDVSWDDAISFCRWAGLSLPTEAEWEKAARGSDGRSYPTGDHPSGCVRDLDIPTWLPGSGSVSPCGAYEIGDLQEWCLDRVGPDDHRAIRGGYRITSGFVTANQEDAWADPVPAWQRTYDRKDRRAGALTFRVARRPGRFADRDMVVIPAMTTWVGVDPRRIDALVVDNAEAAFDAEHEYALDCSTGWPNLNAAVAARNPDRHRAALLELPPRREVIIDSFAIDRVRVSHQQYLAFVEATGHRRPSSWRDGRVPKGREDHPVTDATHDDASAYARWAGLELPSELQWEVAAGADDGRRYPWGEAPPVDAALALGSRHGVLGLIGGWEWCADDVGHGLRALRGGCHEWTRWSVWSRRGGAATDEFGFRCVAPPA